MSAQPTAYPDVATREEWLQDYVFDGPDGEVTLLDSFEGRSQLYIHHFMWIDAVDAGSPSSAAATFTDED